MESSKDVGEMEECNSSESGWTKYLASPMNVSNDDDGGNEEVSDDELEDDDDGGDTSASEDSMASDAASGPAHLETTSYSNANNVIGVAEPEEDNEEADDSEEEDVGKLLKRCNKDKKGRGRASGK